MNEIESILENARQLFVQHAPADMLRQAIPFGIVCLMAGVGLSVLGAKMSRFGIGAAFSLLGGTVGVIFAQQMVYPKLVCGIVGALMLGIIGFQTYRLWVGVVAAVVLSSAVLGTFGYQRIVPHMAEFEHTQAIASLDSPGAFVLPTPEQQQVYRERTPRQWASQLWAYVTERDAKVARNAKALALAAMVTGLCLGVLAVRWALILSTAIIGTALVTTGAATLLTHSVPESYQAFQSRPGLMGMAVGGFLVTSLILQTMLTRNAPRGKPEPSGSSK